MRPVRVLNMTRLFDKEMLIYSFFDIRLKKPARVVFILYFFVLAAIWTVPLLIIFPFNPYLLFLEFGVPFAGASLMSKPIWGGKKFVSFLKTQLQYMRSSKYFYDGKAGKKMVSYDIDNTILVSRRKDYEKLMRLEQRRLDNE